jgi:hypothetical protein
MNEVEILINNLVNKYNYKKLPSNLSSKVKKIYYNNIPNILKINNNQFKIYSLKNTLISNMFNRIVIGDYGAFIEIDKCQIIKNNICIKHGQEYRFYDENYKYNVKYLWLTTIDNSDCKIYFQLKTVSYADYKIGCYYISPYDVIYEQ